MSVNVSLVIIAALAVGEAIAILVVAVALRRSRRRYRRLNESLHSRDGAKRPPSFDAASRAMRVAVKTASRVRSQGVVGGLLMSSLDDLTRWASESRGQIAEVAAPDGTVTLMFSDIENSTALNDKLGDEQWVRVLQAHDDLFRAQIESRGGKVVKSQGDGFMVVFSEVDAALRAATAIQRKLATRPARVLRRDPISVRIGIHIGTAVARDGDYFGRNVAMAARVAAQAHAAEIVVSDEAKRALHQPERFVFLPPRLVELKGLADTHTIWPVRWWAD
jgi:class 3 adenylate cyclase